jgi:hypothetical protein
MPVNKKKLKKTNQPWKADKKRWGKYLKKRGTQCQ